MQVEGITNVTLISQVLKEEALVNIVLLHKRKKCSPSGESKSEPGNIYTCNKAFLDMCPRDVEHCLMKVVLTRRTKHILRNAHAS